MTDKFFDTGHGVTHTAEETLEQPLTAEQALRAEWEGEERRHEDKKVEIERRKKILAEGGNPNSKNPFEPLSPDIHKDG